MSQFTPPASQPKIALITGCSSGIGLHCARRLFPRWRVFATARRAEDVQKLQQEGLESLLLDLDNSDSIAAALSDILQKTDGRIDALFNNGAFGLPAAVEDLSRAALRAQFETNVFGTQELTNAVIAVMRKNGGGRIVQNSSVLGFVPLKYRGAYNASKYALEGLSDTMRLELTGDNIHIALIEPGPITSRFRINAVKQFEKWIRPEKSAHAETYAKLREQWNIEKPAAFELGPEAVYLALIHAFESPSPKIRYRVTIPTKVFWWLKRFLPSSWLDKILGKI